MTSYLIRPRMRDRLTIDELVYIVSMGVALNTSVAGYDIPEFVIYGIAIFWIVIALCRTITISELPLNRGLKPLAIHFAAPKITIVAYSYLLLLLDLVPSGDFGGINQIIAVALPIASVYLYGEKTVDLVFLSCFVSFLFVVPYTCILEGPDSLLAPLRAVFDSTANNPFETHQFTFTAGFLLVYYSLIDREKGYKWKAFGSFAMCFIGFKRIALLAILVVIAVKAIHGLLGKRFNEGFYSAGLVCLAIVSFGFVALLYNGFVAEWMSSHSINVMGRNYYWQVAVSNSYFSPFYLGAGVNSLTHLFASSLYSYLHVGGVHNDILKYYYEIGFVGFVCWISYLLVYLPSWLRKNCGNRAFEAYTLTVLFMFVLFFTDNVDIYYGSQLLFAAIPMVAWLKSRPVISLEANDGEV